MTPDLLQLVLLGYLRRYCAGEAAARTQDRIAGDLKTLGIYATSRDVREAVSALGLAGRPVGTSVQGAFICVSVRDWRRAYRTLYSHLRTQGRRCRRFRQTFREASNGQRCFDFAEAENLFAEIEAAPLLVGAGSVER